MAENQVRTYDPAEVIITVGGIPLTGFADGTFLVVERDEDAFSKSTGADGNTARVKSNNHAGAATITLQQTSPSNDVLSGFAAADELSNRGVVPILIKDLNGASTFFSASAWVRKMPAAEFGKALSDREWVLDCAAIDLFVGGNEQS